MNNVREAMIDYYLRMKKTDTQKSIRATYYCGCGDDVHYLSKSIIISNLKASVWLLLNEEPFRREKNTKPLVSDCITRRHCSWRLPMTATLAKVSLSSRHRVPLFTFVEYESAQLPNGYGIWSRVEFVSFQFSIVRRSSYPLASISS